MGTIVLKDVSPIGFGAFKIGRNEGIKYPEHYALPSEAFVTRLLNDILDLGINYVDTAPAYGLSEERIGRSIGHRRDEYFLSTKVGETFAGGRSVYDFSALAVRESVHRSLQHLHRDVLDLVFVHSNRDESNVLNETDVVETLRSLRDEGLIRQLGFSGHTPDGFRAALAWADAIMVQVHPQNRSLEPVIALAADQGVAVVIKKGLASGTLRPDEAIPDILANPSVTTLVIGGLNLEHMRDNLRIALAARPRQAGQHRVEQCPPRSG